MESSPQCVSIDMQPYGGLGAASPASAFGPAGPSAGRPEPVPSPPDFVLWSFFNALFCNPLCLGFLALVFSVKARDRKIAQDPGGAGGYGQRAKHLNIAALCLGAAGAVACLVLLLTYCDHLCCSACL
ncbi:interferon-induced transmembrane protein 2-like [Rhynochetos jubatus]